MTQDKAMTDDKAYTSHVEKACLEPPAVVDYSGAQAKSSAEEIRLVRKLDFIILPTLWIMWQVSGQTHCWSYETFANTSIVCPILLFHEEIPLVFLFYLNKLPYQSCQDS